MKKILYDISVIVATYNPDYNKLINTLKSIVNQKDCNFEIIISDDGSKQFNKELIIKWMEEKEFNSYTILESKINEGTVTNVYNGVKLAKGKYVKLISPGDYLYCDTILKDILYYMEKNKYEIAFGRAVYYYNENNEIKIINKTNPQDLKPYIAENYKKIERDYLYYQDYILGSAVICNTDLFYKYILKIKDCIKYAEDRAYIMMIADGIKIHFWNRYLLWYECNTGISTSNSIKWGEKLVLDNSECFKMISKIHPEYKRICKIHFAEKYNRNLVFRLKKKCRNKLLKIKNKNFKQDYNINELKKIIEK